MYYLKIFIPTSEIVDDGLHNCTISFSEWRMESKDNIIKFIHILLTKNTMEGALVLTYFPEKNDVFEVRTDAMILHVRLIDSAIFAAWLNTLYLHNNRT